MGRYAIAFIFLFSTPPLNAATETHHSTVKYGHRTKVGVEAGFSLARVSAQNAVDTPTTGGLAAGLVFDKPLSFFFSLRPEILFIQRGTTLNAADGSSTKVKLNSLEIPLLAKLTFNQYLSPYLLAGPVLTVNLSSEKEIRSPGLASSVSLKTYQVGAALGGGMEVGPFFATLRYAWGLTDLDQNTSNWKLQTFDVLAGFRF